jgi:hypothetical protein
LGRLKRVGIAVGVVLALVAVLQIGRATVGGDAKAIAQVVVPRPVERRTLTDSKPSTRPLTAR